MGLTIPISVRGKVCRFSDHGDVGDSARLRRFLQNLHTTPPENLKLFWLFPIPLERPEARASTELKFVRTKSICAARIAKLCVSPISSPPPKAMANALPLSSGADSPPMIGAVIPAERLECAAPNSACPKTELLPKYVVTVGPNRNS